MIKLNLDLQHLKLKLMVDISTDQQPTILSFLKRVLSISCIPDVNALELELYDGEYVLPHLLSSKYIKIDGRYTIRNRKIGKKESQASKADEKQKQRTNNKRFAQSQSQQSDQSQSSSLQQATQLKPIKNNPKTHIQSKITTKKQISSSQSPSKSLTPNNKVNHKGMPKKAPAKVLDSDSSSESDPPIQAKKNKNLIHQNKNKVVLNRVHKQVKKMSSESDSSNKSCERKIRPGNYISKVQEILLNVNQNFHKNSQNHRRQNTNTKPKSIPIALRNKLNKSFGPSECLPTKGNKEVRQAESQVEKVGETSKFIIGQQIQQQAQSYQQSKWVSITKQILKKWENQHQDLPIFDPQNSIRFKVMELDEQKFVPVTTGWISGMIQKSEKEGINTHVRLGNVSKQANNENGSTQFLKQFSVPLHNMQQLQINRATLTILQKQIIQTQEPKKEQNSKKQQKQITNISSELLKPEQSLNDYVCGQISYYFSDKNYPHDLFMKMNANKDEGRFIDVRLMTNFGKIKKVITDDKKVWEFLVNDQKLKSRNYQLDLDRRMLRKK